MTFSKLPASFSEFCANFPASRSRYTSPEKRRIAGPWVPRLLLCGTTSSEITTSDGIEENPVLVDCRRQHSSMLLVDSSSTNSTVQ